VERSAFTFTVTKRLALAVLMALATVPSWISPAGAVAPNVEWTQLSSATTPPARQGEAMAYDPATGQLVLFGGFGGGYLADTWTWNGTTWTQMSPVTSPSPRYGSAMAYDAATGQLVLFGGSNDSEYFSDTWTWNGTTWTHLSPVTSPPARLYHSMAYDAATGQLVLFGGWNVGLGGYLGDTWTWNGVTWTQQSPATSPPVRAGSPMAYDPATGQLAPIIHEKSVEVSRSIFMNSSAVLASI
jgi:hypothetical protein